MQTKSNTSATSSAEQANVTLERRSDGQIDYVEMAGNRWDYVYDDGGRSDDLDRIVPPAVGPGEEALGDEDFTYDAIGRLATHHDGEGRSKSYTYDAAGRVIEVEFGDGSTVAFGYDEAGNRISRTDQRGETTYVHDRVNRLTEERRGNTTINTYTYDGLGNLASRSDAGGSVSYTYDKREAVLTVDAPGLASAISVEHDKDGNLSKVSLPNSVQIERRWDPAGRLQGLKAIRSSDNEVLEDLDYVFKKDADGKLADLREHVIDLVEDRCINWTYDTLSRLKTASHRTVTTDSNGGHDCGATVDRSWEYTYDARSNITRIEDDGQATDLVSNAANVLESAGSTGFDWDAAGNLTQVGGALGLAYNPKGQTSQFTPGVQGPGSDVAYAGLGQSERVSYGDLSFEHNISGVGIANDAAPGGSGNTLTTGSTYYLSLPDGTLLGERTGLGAGSDWQFFLHDGHPGSVIGLLNEQGAKVASFDYAPYGELISDEPDPGDANTPWRFASQWFDEGTGLYKMGERYYMPEYGQWTQQDPLKQSSDLRQGNRFGHAGADPVNMSDPTGMFGLGDIVDIGIDVGLTAAGCATAFTPAGAALCVGGAAKTALDTTNSLWRAFTGECAPLEYRSCEEESNNGEGGDNTLRPPPPWNE